MDLESRRQSVVLVVSLAASLLATWLPDRLGFQFTGAEETIFGVLMFSALVLVDIVWLANKIANRERREEELWVLREACDTELLNISRCFVRIAREAYGSRDLFVAHFRREIRQLAEQITDVAERRQLRVQADHFLNVDNVLDAFQGEAERIWRYTWAVDGSEPLFEELAWRRYFEKTAAMVENGTIKEIRTILIVAKFDEDLAPRVRTLLDFFHTNERFNCCLVSRGHFTTLCSDNSVPASYIDFGIYGDRLLFLTEQYEPEIVGVFTKDAAKIKHYCSLFDSMWNSPSVARRNPSKATERVSLAALYDFDEAPRV